MLWAAVLVWHSLIQSSLLKCPASIWKETAETCYKWAAPIHCQRCQHKGYGIGFGLELITCPFRPCTSKRLLIESPHSSITSSFLLLSAARSNYNCAWGDSTARPPQSTPHHTSTVLLWRKAVAPVRTVILIIIPCIPGEAFLWRFRRIYPFPASHLMHKPYNITDSRVGSCIVLWVAESPWELRSAPSNQRHSHSKLLGSQYYGKWRSFLWVMQF